MTKTEKKGDCVFCDALHKEDGPDNLIIARGRFSFVILNLYPYTSGHLMILPLEHRANLEDLSTEIRFEIMEQTTLTVTVLKKVVHP